MKEASVKTRKRMPVWAVALISALTTAAVLLGLLAVLLGWDGLALMEGWLLARYAFVETDADLDAASDEALSGLVRGLGDRWSYYVAPESYGGLVDSRANRYIGLGITVSYGDEEGIQVVSVVEDGPADRAGVRAGDLIVSVDGKDASGTAGQDRSELLRGEEGDLRVLTLRDESGREREAEVRIAVVAQKVVTARMLDNGMGLVRIRNFNSNSDAEFRAAVNGLVEDGASALIFDVRGNGGGYVAELVRMLDFLLPEGDVFRSDPRWGFASVSHSDADCVSLPFGVLVNAGTYSAAELFAAQLRETADSPIVGELTSGKGYSQLTFRLFNGGALGLSTARYSTGAGVSLIGTGITPDITMSLDNERAALLSQGALEPENDPQLQALIGLMEERC